MALTQFSRLTTATITNYIRGLEDATTRSRIMLYGLRKRGKIRFKVGGTSLEWKVRHSRQSLVSYDDLDPVTYTRQDPYSSANLGWGAYVVSDAITKASRLANTGREQIFSIMQEMSNNLMEDMEDGLSVKLYNGNGTGSEIVGLLNALRFATLANATEFPSAKSANYAGLPLDSATPAGNTGNYWSPIGINAGYNSVDWDTANRPIETMTKIIRRLQVSSGKGNLRARPDVVVLVPAYFEKFKVDVQKKGTVYIDVDKTKLKAADVGFDTVPFNGVDVTYDDAIPTTDIDSQTLVGVVLNFDYIELCSQQSSLFKMTVFEKEENKSILMDLDFFGQLKVRQPRFQGAILTD